MNYGQLQRMKEKAYRHGAVNSQIEIDLPLQIRTERGWTQPQLATQADMKQPRISSIEKPGATHFSLETLRRLAEAFDVALVVRFASFGEFLECSDRFSPDEFRAQSFEQELPMLEARCDLALGAGAELMAQPTEIPIDEGRAELLSRQSLQRREPPSRIPSGAAMALGAAA
jgi:transcriptional regulator with XRE-family HTH domain